MRRRWRRIIRWRRMYYLIWSASLVTCAFISMAAILMKRPRMPFEQACIQMQIWPNHSSVTKFFHKEDKLNCSGEVDWVQVRNGTFQISTLAREKHGNIMCKSITIHNDMDTGKGKLMMDNSPLETDFFQVQCISQDKKRYFNIHSGIAYNASLHKRLRETPRPSTAMGYNVLMFGYDSVSRMTWYRMLPKSQAYFIDIMKGIVLEGYNIVGDGTPQALLPILTGKSEPELPEARKGIHGAVSVDSFPWIWKDFSHAGYVTQWAEDMASIGTFYYRMLGFKKQPTDHYMRPFYLAAEEIYGKFKPFCLGSTLRHTNVLQWLKDLYSMYVNIPKFSFAFHSEYTHTYTSKLQHADDDLLAFLKDLHHSGHLDNTILILMSDHGARFHDIRQTEQGKIEERTPYFAFRFPPNFAEKYPEALRNFRVNTFRLSTPFDIHETLLSIINYDPKAYGDVRNRGISLFNEIPRERGCSHAHIQPHWCACLKWQMITSLDENASEAVMVTLNKINSILYRFSDDCSTLMLHEVISMYRYSVNDHVLKFKGSIDKDGRQADLSDTMQALEILYQVTFVTVPGEGRFEATIRYNSATGQFMVSSQDISRTNKYGNGPWCVMDSFPHLRPYCYCKTPPPTVNSTAYLLNISGHQSQQPFL